MFSQPHRGLCSSVEWKNVGARLTFSIQWKWTETVKLQKGWKSTIKLYHKSVTCALDSKASEVIQIFWFCEKQTEILAVTPQRSQIWVQILHSMKNTQLHRTSGACNTVQSRMDHLWIYALLLNEKEQHEGG